MAAALAEPPPGLKVDQDTLAPPPPGLKVEEEQPKALAPPPPGLKVDEEQPKAIAAPPPGLKIEQPAPALPKKPVTIDPGVDVGFGPGVAPPDLSPVTGRPVSETAPAPSTPTPGVDIGFGPGVAPPADWQKQNLIPGVGVVPTEPPKVWKPPVKAAAPPSAPKPVSIPADVDVGFGPGVAPPQITPEQAGEQAAPGSTELAKTEAVGQQKAAEAATRLPEAVTAVTQRDDPNAQGKETQAPDQTGALQPGRFVYSEADRAQSLVTQTPNKQDLYVRAAKIAADPNIPQAQKDELLNTFAEAATKYAKSDEPGFLEYGWRFGGGAVQTLLHLPQVAENLARFGVSAAQASLVLGKLGTGQEINAQDDAVLHTILASAQEGGASAVELTENIRNWLVKHSPVKPTSLKPTDPNLMSWDQINKLSPDQQREVFLAKVRWLGDRYHFAATRQQGELDPFWSDAFRHLTGHDPNTVASLAEQHVYPDTKAIQGGSMVLSPLNILFPAGEGLIGKSLLAEKAAARSTELTADVMSTLSGIQRKGIEPWAPTVGQKLGAAAGTGIAKGAVIAPLHAVGVPWWMSSWIPVGKQGAKIGGAVGQWIGERPQWIRENIWDPAQKVVAEQANDIRNGTNNVQANYGPLAPLFMRGASGVAKGAAIAAPFAAGAETPEEAGSAIAFGGALGGLHAAGAARDAALSTLFFRDPNKYQSMGFKPRQYGTDYFGKNYDMAHDAWTSGQEQIDQDRINDSRGLLPNVEQYHLGNQDYQDAVTHLQNNGMLPAGNLKSRGFNILKDPNTGKALILVNGDAPGGFATAAHEIGHTIYRTLSQDTKDAFRNAAFQFNDPDALAQYYVGNLVGRNIRYMDLPSESEIANGSKQYLRGLDGYTKEHFVEEMGAETVAALLRGQPLSHFIRNPSLFRRTQLALGTVLNKMGIDVTPGEATTALGVRPGVAQMWIMDKALRDYFKANPVTAVPKPKVTPKAAPKVTPIGPLPKPVPKTIVPPGGGGEGKGPVPMPESRQTAATPKPTEGPAPVPTPSPSGGPQITNNQPEIGGGPTGAPQAAIDDAVKALQALKFPKRQAQQMVAGASGQTAAELLRNALHNHQMAQGRIEVPRAPQEAVQAQAPPMPHPLSAHRELTSPALLNRVIAGDPQAVQALIERHGANWLQAVEKEAPKAAAEFRRKYPEQAAEQDQRIKAGVEAKPEPQRAETDAERAYREKYGTKAAPKSGYEDPNTPPRDAIAARAYELSQERGGAPGHEQEDWAQAEKELRQRAIDAAKARFKGRADFMPMAGEKAQYFPEEEDAKRVFMSPIHGAKQFEIDDRDMTWVAPPKGSTEQTMLEHRWADYVNNPGGTSRLGDIINHPDLFKNYPNLRNVVVEMRPEMRGRGSWQPKDFYPGDPEKITLQSVNRETLAHEIQHAVQFRENWPQGDNPKRIAREMLKDPAIEQDLISLFNAHYPELDPTEFQTQQEYFDYMAKRADQWNQWYLDKIGRMSGGAYLLSPGEIEARAVAKRAVEPPGKRFTPQESLASEQLLTKARVEKEYERMAQLPVGFMPEIPEKPKERLGAGIEDFAARHPFPNLAQERSWFNPETMRYERMPEGAPDVRGKSWEDMTAREIEAMPQPQIPGSKVSFMPDIPAAPKGKKAKAPARVDAPAELRDSLFTPEQRAWLAEAQRKAIAGIDQYPETPLSGVRYADGHEAFPEKMTKAQVGAFFDALNSNKLDFSNPEHQKLMADAATHDVLRRLISNPESLGWYNRVLDGAMDEIGKLEPRILQDPIHNMIMRLAMAITSQNQKVHPNFESAYRAYLYWARTGKLPTDKAFFGGATKSDAMVANFQKINDLIDAHDYNGTEEILKTPMSVREIRDRFDVKVPGEAMGYTSEASIMLGPKIGSFYNNLSKLYHTLTADLWFTRSMNRMAGRMMGFKKGALLGVEEPEVEGVEESEAPDEVETGKHQLGKLRDLITKGKIENATKTQQKQMLKEIDALEAYRDNPDALDRETAMGLSPTIREWAKVQHKIYQNSTGVNKKGEPLGTYGHKTAPNLLGKNIDLNFQNLTDAPRNGTERENFRDIMKQVQSNLAGLGIDITHADNQAVLWYLEQDLFARAKGRKAGAFSADYLDAAYALRQKYQGQTPDQFGKVPEPEPSPPAPKTPRKTKAKAAAMPDVPAYPKARQPIFPSLRMSPVVSQTQEERERGIEIPSSVIMPRPAEVRRGMIMPPRQSALPTQQPSQQLQQRPSEEPSIDIASRSYRQGRTYEGRTVQPQWIVIHSTDANERSSINTLTQGGKSVHYLTTEDGRVLHFVPEADTAFHAGIDKFGKDGNPASIGIEQVHTDGQPWNDTTVQATARTVAGILQRHPNIPLDHVIGHSNLAPGRKVDPQDYPWAKFYDYVRQYMGGASTAPSQQAVASSKPATAGPDQETRRRTGSIAIAHIMHEEGASGVQDGIPEIYGYRKGQDPEYEALARARASGDESTVHQIVAKGLIERAIAAGSQQFSDPAVKAQIISLADMRGPGGARTILNAVASGKIDNSGSVDHLDPEAVKTINAMPRAEFMRRVQIARTVYDKAVHGQEYWNRFGKGLASRYDREREFYNSLN